jgi:photosystem II stability/assembly factor-like uncharacterized protein
MSLTQHERRSLFRRGWLLSLVVFSLEVTPDLPAVALEITSDAFGALRARAIGPATMSGRIMAVEGVPEDPLTIYVGAASGGVWRSKDGGVTFQPIFDRHTQSIGDVKVDPHDPKTIWVGTGESRTRNSVSIGDGVYVSRDGGDTWEHLGLAKSERIARVVLDPKRKDVVWVCAAGPLWSSGEERGVFRSDNGGKSWERVLFVDPDTGCSDLAIDPQDPDVLYAGTWTFRRYPDFFRSGGSGSGLWKTVDGGKSWKRLEQGIPVGEKGRIAVAVAPTRPNRIYALVELGERNTALFRSDDAGASFVEVNRSFNIQVRPFYFAAIVVDPVDFNRVYKPGLTLTVSTDGGKSFTSPFLGEGFGSGPHSDHHDLWIDPRVPTRLLLATDGGLYRSENRGATWSFLKNLPIGQFYKVDVDDQDPYRIYGGLQDNASWVGPSESWGGIQNSDWLPISGGDGFATVPDAEDPQIVYTTIQGGRATRVDLRTGEAKDIQPQPRAGEPELRFNWNTPIERSRHDPRTIYMGAQYLFRTRDRGESWERISPDLTTNDPQRQRQKQSGGLSIDNSSAENNTTIYAIAESPFSADEIWVGTDDGLIQLTRDGGKTWTEVGQRIPGLPRGTWVSSIEVSRHVPGTAYVTIDDHRRGDFRPQLYRTRDWGQSWESLASDPIEGYAWVIKEDPVRPEILYLGTEWGLWVTLDGGEHWARFESGLPKRVAVHDLAFQEREHSLVIATHGRGIYILDDLRPLRQLSAELMQQDVALLETPPVRLRMRPAIGSWFGGDDEFVGSNPPQDGEIFYWLKKRHLFGDLKVEIRNAAGELVASLPGSKRVGLNRVSWPTRMKPPKVPPASALLFGGLEGPRLPEGEYSIRLIKGEKTLEGKVQLVADPRNPHPPEDRKLKQETELRLYRDLERLAYVGENLVEVRDQARQKAALLKGRDRQALERLAQDAEKLRNSFVMEGDGYIGGDVKLRERLGELYGNVLSYEGRPSPSQLERLTTLEAELSEVEQRFERFRKVELANGNRLLSRAGQALIELPDFETWKMKEGSGSKPAPTEISIRALGKWLAKVPQLPYLGWYLVWALGL